MQSPQPKYTVKRIVQILLDPEIPQCKVCRENSKGIRTTTMYKYSDTQKLKCLDDIRKTNVEYWFSMKSLQDASWLRWWGFFVERCAPDAIGDNIVYLRPHCIHPSKHQVKRFICSFQVSWYHINESKVLKKSGLILEKCVQEIYCDTIDDVIVLIY